MSEKRPTPKDLKNLAERPIDALLSAVRRWSLDPPTTRKEEPMLNPESVTPLEDSPDFDVLSLVEADVWGSDTHESRAIRVYTLALEMRAAAP